MNQRLLSDAQEGDFLGQGSTTTRKPVYFWTHTPHFLTTVYHVEFYTQDPEAFSIARQIAHTTCDVEGLCIM